MQTVTLARQAMATRFELVLAGGDPARLRAAGEEALDEIDRIEGLLSIYRPASEIAQVNARAGREPVRVSPEVFLLLRRAQALAEFSGGAFDIAVAPLVRCWGFMKGSGRRPTDADLTDAREASGMGQIELDEAEGAVRFRHPGAMLDLGSIGKGYALDAAAEFLRDAGVEHALLHGGTSTILAAGASADGSPWKVAIERPPGGGEADSSPPVLAVVELEDQALSVSAVWGKFFVLEGKSYGHVIDPRTGWPAENALLGAALAASAADSDALSTAILLAKEEQLAALNARWPGLRYLQARLEAGQPRFASQGLAIQPIAVSGLAAAGQPAYIPARE